MPKFTRSEKVKMVQTVSLIISCLGPLAAPVIGDKGGIIIMLAGLSQFCAATFIGE